MGKTTNMINSHLYTNKLETPLFSEHGGSGEPVCLLGLNNWVGVLQRLGNWYHVITIHSEGWINVNDVEERSPLNLHVRWEPGKPIEYVNAA